MRNKSSQIRIQPIQVRLYLMSWY